MIHTLLNLTRPLFVIDCETTGVDVQKDRIIEFGFEQWMPDARCTKCEGIDSALFKTPCEGCGGTRHVGGLVKEWRSYINPCVPMPAGAQSVHGITDEFLKNACRHCQRVSEGDCVSAGHDWAPLLTFKELASSLARGFTDCDYAGKNVRFDLRILANEMTRAGQAWSYAGARIIDAERLEQLAVPRDLGSLHEKYTGKRHDGAHGALSDVRASTTVIVKQLETHVSLPRDIDALHEMQWPGWLVADGSFRMVNGVALCMFGKHRDKPIKNIPADYWDWLLSQNFPDDVRQLARDAKIGKYPEVSSGEVEQTFKREH